MTANCNSPHIGGQMNNPNDDNRYSNDDYEEVELAPHGLLTPSPLPSTQHSVSNTLRIVSMDGDVKLPFHAVSDIKRRINALTCLISLTGMVGLVTAGLLTYLILWSKFVLGQSLKAPEIVGNDLDQLSARTNKSLAKVDGIYSAAHVTGDTLHNIVTCPSGYFKYQGHPCSKGTILMKLKAGSSTFHYGSEYWTNYDTLNEQEVNGSDDDDIDAKLKAFNSLPFSTMLICYRHLTNCYKYSLGVTVRSARVLFSGGFRPSRTLGGGGGKRNWTELFFPEGEQQYDTFWNGCSGKGCTMTRPGINTVCGSHESSARIGYCVNNPDEACTSGHEKNGVIGIGLKTLGDPQKINGPYGGYTVFNHKISPPDYHQAWILAH